MSVSQTSLNFRFLLPLPHHASFEFFYDMAFVIYVYKVLHLSEGPGTLGFFSPRNHLNLAVFYPAGSGTQGSMPVREVSASVLVTFLLLW